MTSNPLLAVLSCELVFFYLLKIAREDLLNWVLIYGTWGSWYAFITRLLCKVVTDWTCIVQMRHPNEVGRGGVKRHYV